MAKRMSVSLDDEDLRLLETFGAAGSHESASLRAWAEQRGLTSSGTEAALLRLLARAGAEALRDHVLDSAYAQLAIEIDVEHNSETRAARDRYLDRSERSAAE